VTAPEVRIVKDWHEALNGDPDRLVELSHPDVEVGGLRAANIDGSHEVGVV
jgi:hypothetical protein